MSFITGAVGKDRSVAVLGQLEGEDDNPLDAWRAGFWIDGKWCSELDLDFKPVGLSPLGTLSGAWAILGSDGEVLWVENVDGKPRFRKDQIRPSQNHAFTTMAAFDGGVVAGQMGPGAYWSDGGEWRQLGQGMGAHGVEAFAVTGKELYACGWKGEIWQLQKGSWRQIDSPTTVILTGAASDPGGRIVVCGRLGLLLRGRGKKWAIIDRGKTDEDFWSVATFRSRVFVSSLSAIYELAGDTITPVDDETAAESYYHLSSNDLILASIGARAVIVYDGEQWQSITG